MTFSYLSSGFDKEARKLADRLVADMEALDVPALVKGLDPHIQIVHDEAGNVTAMAMNPVRNQLLFGPQWTAQAAVCLRHDALGRLVNFGTLNKYTNLVLDWDNPKNDCQQDGNIATIAHYRYDHKGRRVERDGPAIGGTYFYFDAAGELLSEGYVGTALNQLVWDRDYVWLDGEPLAQVEYQNPSGAGGAPATVGESSTSLPLPSPAPLAAGLLVLALVIAARRKRGDWALPATAAISLSLASCPPPSSGPLSGGLVCGRSTTGRSATSPSTRRLTA